MVTETHTTDKTAAKAASVTASVTRLVERIGKDQPTIETAIAKADFGAAFALLAEHNDAFGRIVFQATREGVVVWP